MLIRFLFLLKGQRRVIWLLLNMVVLFLRDVYGKGPDGKIRVFMALAWLGQMIYDVNGHAHNRFCLGGFNKVILGLENPSESSGTAKRELQLAQEKCKQRG